MYQKSIFARPAVPQPPKKRLIRYILWTAFKRMLMAIGALVLFSAIMGTLLTQRLMEQRRAAATLPSQIVLYLPLDGDFPAYREVEMPFFGEYEMTMRDMIDALDRAADDSRVKGLVTELRGSMTDVAQLQELRAAVLRFQAAGKFAYIYGSSYGDPGSGLGMYYLASAFGQIWMQPIGEISMAGIRAEVPFARAALEKIGIEPQFFARKEYKTLFESATSREMSPQSREMLSSLVNDMAGQFVAGIAEARKIDPANVKKLVDQGMFTDHAALEAKLVDHLEDYEVLRAKIIKDVTGKTEADDLFAGVDLYAQHMGNPVEGTGLALVYIDGAIMPAGAGSDFVAAEDIADSISDAADDDNIKAIVLRINSPGGSPSASETIRRAVVRAQARGKKVVVSMGGMAASGGYWAAASADRIFALPGTITGSIGVAGGKVSLRGLWDKAGINWDSVQYGETAGLMSLNEPFSPAENVAMNRMMDSIYDAFISRVAEGRKMTPEKVDKIAGGRIWTGRQAKENGLVDDLGGLDAALDYAAKLAGAENHKALAVYVYPQPVTPVERMKEFFGLVTANENINTLMKSYGYARHAGQMTVWLPLSIH